MGRRTLSLTKMKVFLTLIFLGSLASTQADPALCSYDYICSTGDTASVSGTDARDCQDACVNDDTCNFWTFENYRNNPLCFLLTSCTLHETCGAAEEICSSGPKLCGDMPQTCDKLDYSGVQQDSKTWKCLAGTDPYSKEIPFGTACEIACPTWKDSNTDSFYPDTVRATCNGAGWDLNPDTIQDAAGSA